MCVYLFVAAGKLELKFAAQSGVSILPIKSEKGFVATSWLGIITAGKLWAELVDENEIEAVAPTLIEQIKKVVPEHELTSFHSDALRRTRRVRIHLTP